MSKYKAKTDEKHKKYQYAIHATRRKDDMLFLQKMKAKKQIVSVDQIWHWVGKSFFT